MAWVEGLALHAGHTSIHNTVEQMSQPQATVSAFPAKRFFVDMLTRDIEMGDAILDLLDNCVDGALRSGPLHGDADQPYSGRWAEITFTETSFTIADNCGGIPRDVAIRSAFRLGRPDPTFDMDRATVGVYGIGMKRAIFKIGRSARVESRTSEDAFTVNITSGWLEDDTKWELPLEVGAALTAPGTAIHIDHLRDGVGRMFSNETTFAEDLIKDIQHHYGLIIQKGFVVRVNGTTVDARRVAVLVNPDAFVSGRGIAPYVHAAEFGGVHVTIVAGLYRDLPTDDEEEEERDRPSSDRAGVTVICNDRVVAYADKTKMTGWGEAQVPQYHTQFVSIAATVIMRSTDASKLPFTTTKRGLDGNSELYLNVKNSLREGLKHFTDYTNKWKKASHGLRAVRRDASPIAANEIAAMVPDAMWKPYKGELGGRRFRPDLPLPLESDPARQMRVTRRMSEINTVARYLYGEPADGDISKVAGDCFDRVLAEAKA